MPRPPRRRKPADPLLMGEPSPALTKIARMNTEKLDAHIKTMQTESERLETKITNLSNIDPPDQERIEQLKAHRERLAAIMEAASKQLAGKLERREQYGGSGGRGGPAGPSGSGGSRGYRR